LTATLTATRHGPLWTNRRSLDLKSFKINGYGQPRTLRVRLRIRCRKAWGFKSPLSHPNKIENSSAVRCHCRSSAGMWLKLGGSQVPSSKFTICQTPSLTQPKHGHSTIADWKGPSCLCERLATNLLLFDLRIPKPSAQGRLRKNGFVLTDQPSVASLTTYLFFLFIS
jgi:hypothetical protein